jgi:hypothetical protein
MFENNRSHVNKYWLKLLFLFHPEIYLINLAKIEIKFGCAVMDRPRRGLQHCNQNHFTNPTFSTMDFVHAIVILKKKKLMTKSVSHATSFLSLYIPMFN